MFRVSDMNTVSKRSSTCVMISFSLLIGAARLPAQGLATARISGTVTHGSGAVVAHAVIRATNVAATTQRSMPMHSLSRQSGSGRYEAGKLSTVCARVDHKKSKRKLAPGILRRADITTTGRA